MGQSGLDILLQFQETLPMRVPAIQEFYNTLKNRVAEKEETRNECADLDEGIAGDDKRSEQGEC